MTRHTVFFATAALAGLLTFGCSSSLTARRIVQPAKPVHPRIAILPFENLSGKEKAGVKVTDYFHSLMTANPRYETVPYGQSFDVLRKLRVRSAALITNEQIDSVASLLNLDYLLTGSVLEYDEFENTYLGRTPQVSFNTRLIECSTGKTIWVGVANGSGDKGEVVFGLGAVRSADNLARSMVSDAVVKFSAAFAKQ
ncbi:MAG: hypothetical protein AB1644_07955 [Candidatus Zixiibacteriota bacterium]